MKKLAVISAIVAVLGMVAIPVFAYGGFGGMGMANTLNEEDYEAWLADQVEDGWITQKMADEILSKRQTRLNGLTEEEFAAQIDEKVADGWITERQAEYMKENYKAYQERLEQYSANLKQRGSSAVRGQRAQQFGKGRRGASQVGIGMANTLNDEDYEAWLVDQVEDGWITQKMADEMLSRRQNRLDGLTEEEFAAKIDEQVADGWITERQAEYMKENYKNYQERFENYGADFRQGGQQFGRGRRGGCQGGKGFGMMGGF